MAFRKMIATQYPPRLWSLVGYPRMGKSTFASQMKGPMVVVDADHRFTEVLDLAQDAVYELSPNKEDNVNPDMITELLGQNMPGSGVQTIVVDSLTAIITPLVVQAMIDHENKKARNLAAAFKGKALAMRQIQDAVTRWGSDVLWIYHLQDARDGQAKAITRATISQTETDRLTRSINLQLQIEMDGDKRGIRVVWARRGRSGMVIWDDTGSWDGMPEKVEEAVYGGLSNAEQDAIERDNAAQPFANPDAAVNFAIEQGAFTVPEEAHKAYERVKREGKPTSANAMAMLWRQEVERIVASMAGEAFDALDEL